MTVCAPKVDAGTLKVAVNNPLLSVATVATVNEPNVMVTVELAVKPVPETVTRELTAPDVGLRVIPGTTAKVDEAKCEKASVAVTVCAPFVETGTVNVTVKPPVAPVLEVPMLFESNFTVIVEDAEKPNPVMLNEEPDCPLVGVRVIDATTVNVALAV